MVSPLPCIDAELISHARSVVEILKRNGQTVVTAESCTAGLVAAALSYAEGAGDCLHGGFVVYTKQHKIVALGVSRSLLEQQGSVHAVIAQQMAEGALGRSAANIAIAITGVLGPNPDEDGAQPGHVFIAVGLRGRSPLVNEVRLPNRHPDELRCVITLHALELVRDAASYGGR